LEVGASARRNGKPTGDLDVILQENAGSSISVRILGNVAGKIDLSLGGNANHPRVAVKRAAGCEFSKK